MTRIFEILVAAIVSVLIPATARAATVTYTWGTYQTASDQNFVNNVSAPVPIVGGQAFVSAGSFIRFSLNATVNGDINSAANIAGGTSIDIAQPAVLGLGTVSISIANSNPTQLTPVAVLGNSTANIPSIFDVRQSGVVLASDGSVGVGSPPAFKNLLAAGINAGNVDVTEPMSYNKLVYGVGTLVSVFTDLRYSALGGGAVTLTPNLPLASQAFVTPGKTLSPSYTTRTATTSDVIVGPGNLVVGFPEPSGLTVVGLAVAGLMARRRKA